MHREVFQWVESWMELAQMHGKTYIEAGAHAFFMQGVGFLVVAILCALLMASPFIYGRMNKAEIDKYCGHDNYNVEQLMFFSLKAAAFIGMFAFPLFMWLAIADMSSPNFYAMQDLITKIRK